jgi:hypothetical protein
MNNANETSIVMRPHQGSVRIKLMTEAHSFPLLSASQPTRGDAEPIFVHQQLTVRGGRENKNANRTYR